MIVTLTLFLKDERMVSTYGMPRTITTIKGVGSCVLLLMFVLMFRCDTERALDTPEAVTLAQQLVNRQTTKTQLINDGFNRYSLNSKEGLPSWFLDDESKFYKPNLPITKEAVAALREKQRALDARPIKKVAEAKARKKFKAQQRLEKAMKKAEGVNATSDMSEREKAQQIEKLMRKGMSSGHRTKKDIKVVVAKGIHKGVKGRPKGVKGRYTMVDARMRKEVRSNYVVPSLPFDICLSFGRKNVKKRQTRSVSGLDLLAYHFALFQTKLSTYGLIYGVPLLHSIVTESSETFAIVEEGSPCHV